MQSFKDIRAKATEVLNEMSADLLKLAEGASTREAREVFTSASKSIQTSSGVRSHHIFLVLKLNLHV